MSDDMSTMSKGTGEPEQARVVYVTGGAQGIGKGIAVHLLSAGYHVVIADVDREAGEQCVRELKGSGFAAGARGTEAGARGVPEFHHVDVRSEEEVAGSIRSVIEGFGRLDAAVNNAGIADPDHGPLEELDLEAWRRVIDTNLTGAFLVAKHAAPHLRQANGSVVNIASTRALQSEPDSEPYAASKGGILALTHAMAMSLGPDVRVNAISPGWIEVSEWKKHAAREEPELRPVDHHQHPAGRVGRPTDIASMVAYLISDQAGFITGQNFVVDGGMTRKMIYAE